MASGSLGHGVTPGQLHLGFNCMVTASESGALVPLQACVQCTHCTTLGNAIHPHPGMTSNVRSQSAAKEGDSRGFPVPAERQQYLLWDTRTLQGQSACRHMTQRYSPAVFVCTRHLPVENTEQTNFSWSPSIRRGRTQSHFC